MSIQNITISKTNIYPLGSNYTDNGIRFSACMDISKECGILLFIDDANEPIKILFPKEMRQGRICSMEIQFDETFVDLKKIKTKASNGIKYLLFNGEEVFPDPYMRDGVNFGDFGTKNMPISRVCSSDYEMSNNHVFIPFENSIYYMLHVRGFTAHSSSKVKNKGTFKGVIQKIPYIKSLGITSVIFMPLYEFEEVIDDKDSIMSDDTNKKINYWGYTDGYYYMPKTAFSSSDNASCEMKSLVDELHKNNLEIIMQFYFPAKYSGRQITDILSFWHLNFGIDGFQLIGEVPIKDILSDPILYDCKILYDTPIDILSSEINPKHAYLDRDFMINIRQFLKGDPNSSYNASLKIKTADPVTHPINFIARQDTMRAYDIVCFNEKHNEDNGENGRDGADYNYSWNCGIEGPSRRKNIVELRTKQYKNAMALAILSQGAPLIYSGDEFGNTQYGNNNPYNQDNATGYIKWPSSKYGKELLSFVKELIAIRKNNPSLGTDHTFFGRDYLSYGYPDISLHGDELWRADLGPTSHNFGILLFNKYADVKDERLLFIAYNMHWETAIISLPNMKKSKKWKLILATEKIDFNDDIESIEIPPRSIAVFETVD